jgi:prepilin-type N-terminal cleavage/methylation domain-containing protein
MKTVKNGNNLSLVNLRRSTGGFTVIEVLVVLSIASLILLVVFLAIPSLQRNSRNAQQRADAASIMSLVTEFASNQSGSLPGNLCLSGKIVTAGNGTCGSLTNAVTANVSSQTTAVAITTPLPGGPLPVAGTVTVYWPAICQNNTPAAGNGRQFVAFFGIEPGNRAQCLTT